VTDVLGIGSNRAGGQRTPKFRGIYNELSALANYHLVALHLSQMRGYSRARSANDAREFLVTDWDPEHCAARIRYAEILR
jgi:hypothetical protein